MVQGAAWRRYSSRKVRVAGLLSTTALLCAATAPFASAALANPYPPSPPCALSWSTAGNAGQEILSGSGLDSNQRVALTVSPENRGIGSTITDSSGSFQTALDTAELSAAARLTARTLTRQCSTSTPPSSGGSGPTLGSSGSDGSGSSGSGDGGSGDGGSGGSGSTGTGSTGTGGSGGSDGSGGSGTGGAGPVGGSATGAPAGSGQESPDSGSTSSGAAGTGSSPGAGSASTGVGAPANSTSNQPTPATTSAAQRPDAQRASDLALPTSLIIAMALLLLLVGGGAVIFFTRRAE